MLLSALFLFISLLISEEMGLREDVLNDMAFQQVWTYLENKDISKEYVLNAFQNTAVKTHPKIIDSFNNPYEKKGWEQYRKIFITEKRIKGGIDFYFNNKRLIEQVSDSLNVDQYLLVSLVGVESNYGKHYGQYSVFNALYTLIHQLPRKKKWAAKELSEFIILCYGNNIDPHSIKGSYAGAFGFGQFIPSSFRAYAVDFDDDKIKEPFDWLDVFASMSNYLIKNGYKINSDDFSYKTNNWNSIYRYNHSANYVNVILELRKNIIKGILSD